MDAGAAARRRRAGEQRAHPRGHGDLAGDRPRGVDPRVEDGLVGVDRLERQRRHRQGGVGEAPGPDGRERGATDRHGVAAEQGHRVAGAGHERLDPRPPERAARADGAALDPRLALAEEGQADGGELRQVARAERADVADDGNDVRAQRGRERVEQAVRCASAAGAELVQPDGHRRADGGGGERLARSGGVAAQQRPLVARGVRRRDRPVVQRAHAGRHAVDGGPGGDHGLERLARRGVARPGGVREPDARGAVRDRGDGGGRERAAVERDRRVARSAGGRAQGDGLGRHGASILRAISAAPATTAGTISWSIARTRGVGPARLRPASGRPRASSTGAATAVAPPSSSPSVTR